MASNVEIKARARDWPGQLRLAASLRGRNLSLFQQDTFFRVPVGRLKLREFGRGAAQLIFYTRTDRSGPKVSTYSIAPVGSPAELKALLAEALGMLGVVTKKRTVFLVGQSRIHFDDVEKLGRFIEIEVVLSPGQTPAQGRKIARGLMAELDIRPADLIKAAYADLQKRMVVVV